MARPASQPFALYTLALAMAFLVSFSVAQKYEERHSFKPPFPVVRGSYLASWEFAGSTVVTEEYVRLTPAIKSRTGSIWNIQPVHFDNWEVIMEFRIGGGGKLGADGLALWYVAEIKHEGSVFGSQDKWRGLGIFFDTFDNDGMRDNPQISIVLNDGTIDWRDDGKQIQAGGCHAQFRNPYRNVRVKITHVNNNLDVSIDTGTNTWENCASGIQANLPLNYFFGLTAATGGLFDNHDVYAFETYNLDSAEEQQRVLQEQQQQHQQQQEQQRQEQGQPLDTPDQPVPAADQDNRFGDILNKLNNIGGDPQQPPAVPLVIQPNSVDPAAQQQPPQQQQQQVPQQQQQVPQQQQQQVPQQQQQQVPQQQQQVPQQQQQQQQQQQVPQQQQQRVPQQQQQQPYQTTDQQQQLQQFMQGQASGASIAETVKQISASINDLSGKINSLQHATNTNNNNDNGKQIEQLLQQQKVIAEAFGNLLKSVALKSDVDELKASAGSQYNNFQRDMADVRQLLNDVKATVNSRLGTKNDDIIRTLEDVNQNVNQLKKGVEQTKESTKQIAGNLQQNQQEIATTIEKSTSFGFWTYFLFIQAIFIFGYVWWRKHRDDSNKKLL